MKTLLKTVEDYRTYVRGIEMNGGVILSEPPKHYPCVAIRNNGSWITFVYLDDFSNEESC